MDNYEKVKELAEMTIHDIATRQQAEIERLFHEYKAAFSDDVVSLGLNISYTARYIDWKSQTSKADPKMDPIKPAFVKHPLS